jgi:HTH-type transcriptional regulator/antitoxin HigA
MSFFMRSEMLSPGSYLRDELHDRGWSIAEFSQRAGITVEQVRALLAAAIPVTPSVAKAIGQAFGTDSELWMGLERSFGRWKLKMIRGY